MNKYDEDELDAFIVEADLINQKIKALAENRMSPEEFDKLQVARAEDKRKREEGKKRREQQAYEKKRQGRDGKGITKDFHNFCRFCHREYELPTPVCFRCNKNTMTLQQRQEQLQVMVNEYKNKKKSREQRKDKWQRWQKTKSMLWKKTSNSYEKWDYFISDSQEQPQAEPIVPKNDPNFMALEKDMEERKQRRMKDTAKAKKLKEKGNEFMKQGKHQQAIEQYTLALEFIRDIKSIYTNRALAYIKIGKFKRAIKDCTNVIEYMEVFEKQNDNKDICFKAHLRRAVANKELKNYKQALEDAEMAIKFYPNDKQAEILKKEIQGFLEHKEKVQKLLRQNKNPQSEKKPQKQDDNQENVQKQQALPTEEQSKLEQRQIIRQLAEAQMENKKAAPEPQKQTNQLKKKDKKQKFQNELEEVKYRIENLDKQNIEGLFILFKKNPEMVNIFIASKGIKKCLEQILQSEQCLKEGYLISTCLRGDGVGEKEVWDFKINKIYKRISDILSDNTEMSMSKYFILEDIFQILIPMSLHQKYREILADCKETYQFIEQTFGRLISRHKKQPDLFSSFLIFTANLCSGNSKLRDSLINGSAFQVIVGLLYEKVLLRKTMNRSYLNLKKNVFSTYANLIINIEHRNRFIAFFNGQEQDGQKKRVRWWDLIKDVLFYPKSQDNFNEYMEALLSVFTNVALGTSLYVQGLPQALIDRFLSNPSIYNNQILHRALLTLSRIKHRQIGSYKNMLKYFSIHLETWKSSKGRNLMEQIIRALNLLYMGIQGKQTFNEKFPDNLLKQCKLYISSLQFGQTIFCNTCNMFGLILDHSPASKSVVYAELKPNIKFLISVAKDKVGNWRKNASILLAKLSINPQCKEELYKNHGMEVLKSIAEFVKK